jgi:hypothetical protein
MTKKTVLVALLGLAVQVAVTALLATIYKKE